MQTAHEKTFSRAIWPHDNTDPARCDCAGQIINQRAIIERQGDVLNLDRHDA